MWALLAVYIDPTLPAGGGLFTISPWALGALSAHLAYSALTYRMVTRSAIYLDRIALFTAWGDIAPGSGELCYYPGGHRVPHHLFGGARKHWIQAQVGKKPVCGRDGG